MSPGLLEDISKKLDKYENFLELIFAALLLVSFLMVVISIGVSLTDFSKSSGFYSPEAVVGFMASFLALLLLADAFKLSVINFTERKRMKVVFTIAIVGSISNILVNTRLSDNIFSSMQGVAVYILLLLVSLGGFAVADRYGFSEV